MIPATLLAFLLAFMGVAGVTGLARRRGLLDLPGERSSHGVATPTGAGLGLVLGLCLAAWIVGGGPRFGTIAMPGFWLSCALPLALALAIAGFLDDWRGLAAWPRLLLQALAAAVLLGCLGGAGQGGLVGILAWVLLVVLQVWTMNAYNFMDGSNGMAGAQGVLSGVMLAAVFLYNGAPGLALAAAGVAAACIAFLPWNAPRARVFMGDAGSVPLGFLLGGLGIAGALQGVLPWPLVVLVLAVFHVDAGLTLLTRLFAGERWYTAHRRHVYQRLIVHGWSHGRVLLLYAALNVFIVAPGMALGVIQAQWAWWVAGAACFLLAVTWYAVSLKLGERGT